MWFFEILWSIFYDPNPMVIILRVLFVSVFVPGLLGTVIESIIRGKRRRLLEMRTTIQ